MSTDTASLPPFEIFAAGRHTAMSGDTLAFGEAEIAASVQAYDRALYQAPICVGHPKHDKPAYGWIAGITASDGRMSATSEQVDTAFAEMVRAGRFKTRSVAFFRPDSPNNPKPGVWYVRHVAFLGAQPPAVKGLKPIQFAEDDDGVVVFGDVHPGQLGYALRSLLGFVARIRDTLVERDGLEKANQVIPDWELQSAQDAASRLETDTHGQNGPCLSAPPTDNEVPTVTTKPGQDEEELARRARDLDAREAAFAEKEAGIRRQENETFLDTLVKEGRFAPGLKTDALAFMEKLDATGVVAFAEGVSKTPLQAFRDLCAQLPKTVEFGEVAPDDDKGRGTVAFAAPSGCEVDKERLAIHAKAQSYQAQHPGTDYATAVRAVGGN